MRFFSGVFVCIFIFLFASVSSVSAYYTNMPANIVIGQTDFTSDATGSTRTLTSFTRGMFVDPNGRLILSDEGNNRVLIYNQVPTSNNTPADLVLGQANFTDNFANRGAGTPSANTMSTPLGSWSDGNKLFVADGNNNRILVWNSFPTQNGQEADYVIGQNDFSSTTNTCNALHLSVPRAVSVHGGKLIIADTSHNRILIYNNIPTTSGVEASRVMGQTGFGTCANAITQTTLNAPRYAMVDPNGKVIVADRSNNRVMIWNQIPTTNGVGADVVVGKTSFTQTGQSATQTTMTQPQTAFSDGRRLYVVDSGNQRVTIWNSIPEINGAPADIVIGQSNFTNIDTGLSATMFNQPANLFATATQLLVADNNNHRVLIFPNTLATPAIQLSGEEPAPNGRVQINGSVVLGNTPTYSLQRIQASINGSGYNNVTNLGAAQSLGNGQNYYPFFHQFQPWENNTPQESWEDRGYTVKFRTTNSNAEDNFRFYMNPLTLNSANSTSIPILKFTVPKTQWDRIKDNLSGFSALVKPINSKEDVWTNYTGNVATNNVTFYPSGEVVFTARPQSGLSIKAGKYWVKVVANDKWGNTQESNVMETSLTDFSGAPHNPLGLPIVGSHIWFPLQVNKITGVNTGGVISTTNLNGIKSTYTSSTNKPTFTGIAMSGATVAMNVTDQKTNKTTLYTTTAVNSQWTLTPTITANSVINLSVWNQNSWYNELLPLVFTLSGN